MKHEKLEIEKMYKVSGTTKHWKQYEKFKGGLQLKISLNGQGVKIAEIYDSKGKWFASRNILLADKEFEIIGE